MDRPVFGTVPPTPFRRLSPHANALVLNRVHAASAPEVLLRDVIHDQYRNGIALVSSFGADSAVLLHMVSKIDPATPVLFLETGMLFPETLAYQRDLASRLGLSDLRLIRPAKVDLAGDDPDGTLHRDNTDACCFIRKTLPLRRALEPYGAWITGRKRAQATTRSGLELFEEDRENGLLKVNPLAHWDGAMVRAYMTANDLPPHPLVARGYPSIGRAPCTTQAAPGEDPRAGRWRASGKVECGIHFDGEKWVEMGTACGGLLIGRAAAHALYRSAVGRAIIPPMEFTGEIATIQQRLAACQEMAARRHAVLQELAPRRGERVIEVGCGAGLLLRDIGLALGPHGLAAGVDVSADQIAAAARECAEVPAVKPMVCDIRALDYPDAVFDAAVAVQVVEYIEDAPGALAELRRVLKSGGRFHCLATNWDSAFWHGPDEALTAEITDVWDSHAPWPNLPARLPPMLARAGFDHIRTLPVPIVNPDLHENTFAWWIARLMAAYAVGQGVAPVRAEEWLNALDAAEAEGEFFFSSVPILTTAIAA